MPGPSAGCGRLGMAPLAQLVRLHCLDRYGATEASLEMYAAGPVAMSCGFPFSWKVSLWQHPGYCHHSLTISGRRYCILFIPASPNMPSLKPRIRPEELSPAAGFRQSWTRMPLPDLKVTLLGEEATPLFHPHLSRPTLPRHAAPLGALSSSN